MIDLSKVPKNPGCYLFKDKNGEIIYIGKAKNLKKRVTSYFSKQDKGIKTEVLVGKIKDVDFIVTNTEVEALILENNLIKKNVPKYNIDLKDSKGYAYLKITNEEFPRLVLERKKTGEGKFFGPFVSGQSRDYLQDFLIKTFKIRTCNKLPKRPCLRYHIKLCDAPCVYNVKSEYLENIKACELVLSGKTTEVLKGVSKKMSEASESKKYERAIILREQIRAIEWLNEKQSVEKRRKYDEDVINFIIRDEKVYLILFNVKKGVLINKQSFEFDFHSDFLEEFLVRYYSESEIPKEIVIPKEMDVSVRKYLSKLRGGKVKLIVPQKGNKKELLDLVEKNVELQYFGDKEKLEELMKKINMNDLPEVIECFDVSHLSGTSTVASMVQFRGGKPDKSNYRKYKLRTVDGIDDFKAMGEVVRRRYTKLKLNGEAFPDLILIDGGAGQLNYSIDELNKLNLKIPIISLAKREEEIYIPGRKVPLALDKKNKGLLLLMQIRDEAHRFAISYNRLLRKKKIRE